MANKKPTKPTQRKNWAKYTIIGVIVVLFVPVFAFVGYQKYLDKVDAERFSTLQSDFKKLQTEFNKIDPGWEYSEGCTAGGKLDDFKTCSVSLSNDNMKNDNQLDTVLEAYRKLLPEFDAKIGQRDYINDDGLPAVNMQLKGRGMFTGVLCDLSTTTRSGVKIMYVYCRDSARNFYFDRTDR